MVESYQDASDSRVVLERPILGPPNEEGVQMSNEMRHAADEAAGDAIAEAVTADTLHADAVQKAVESEALREAADELAAQAIVEEAMAEDLAADAVDDAETSVALAEMGEEVDRDDG